MSYEDACAHLLDLKEGEVYEGGEEELEEAKGEWRAKMRMYERSIRYTACLQDAQMLREQLLNLQRTAFYARYGDMFAEVCRQLRNELCADIPLDATPLDLHFCPVTDFLTRRSRHPTVEEALALQIPQDAFFRKIVRIWVCYFKHILAPTRDVFWQAETASYPCTLMPDYREVYITCSKFNCWISLCGTR